MGEVSSVVDLLGALMRLLGLEENALFPAIALLIVFFLFAIPVGLLAQARKARTGAEGIVGETGEAVTDLRPEGKVFVHSEYWNAVSDEPVTAGEAVRVVGSRGMVLRVEREKAGGVR
jgi:membrane-bound serine protease (ClpP class)